MAPQLTADERLGTAGQAARILERLELWATKASATLIEVQQLCGLLCWASQVITQGRLFLARLFALIRAFKGDTRAHFQLSPEFKKDLKWWQRFMALFNGTRKLIGTQAQRTKTRQYGDASDTGGAAVHQLRVLQAYWNGFLQYMAKEGTIIAVREMWTLVAGALNFGADWSGMHVEFMCDNKGDVDSFFKWRNSNLHTIHLMRVLAYVAALYDFTFEVIWICTRCNDIADLASRTSPSQFHSKTGGRYHSVPLRHIPPRPDDEQWESRISAIVLPILHERQERAKAAARKE